MTVAKLTRRIGFVIATVIILAALIVSVGRMLTPFLNDHLPNFESWSSELLHVPVKIDHVGISWNIYEPEIVFDRVTMLDTKTQQSRFAVQQIKVNLNILRSLFTLKPVIQTIKVSGAHLTIRQPTTNKIFIDELKELAVTDNETVIPSHFDEVLAWIFTQPNLILEDIDILYYLPSGNKKSITFQHLELQNDSQNHALNGDATLNQEIPTHAHVHLQWQGAVTDFQHVSAEAYLYLEGVSLPQWFSQFSWHNLQIKQGVGSAKIWLTWKNNRFEKIQTQLQFYDLAWTSTLTHKTQQIQRLSGNFGWRMDGDKQIFAGDDILLDLPEHLWPSTNFTVVIVPNANGGSRVERVHVGYLDLADTKDFLFFNGLVPDDVKKLMTTLNLQGELREVNLSLPALPWTNLATIKASTQFSHLGFNQWQSNPALKNAHGLFEWNGVQGSLTLDSQKTALIYNKFFSAPLQFDQLAGLVTWQKLKTGDWSVVVKNLQLLNSDLKAHGGISLSFPVNASPTINLSANFTVSNVAHLANYIPLKVMKDADLVAWLQNAFVSGEIQAGKAVLQGRFTDFPFEKNNGKFIVSGILKNFDLHYAPKWPDLKNIQGMLTFAGSAMTVEISSGQMLNIPLTMVHAKIPYIGDLAPQILHIQTNINADFANALDFIDRSPLANTLGKDLAELDLRGPMQMNLGLVIPLKYPDKTTVQGDMALANAALELSMGNLAIEQLNGAIHFTEQDIQAKNLTGKLFNEPITLTLATQHESKQVSYVKAVLNSRVSMADLQAWSKMPVTDYAQGTTAYQVELNLASHDSKQASHVIIKSDLKGIAVNLPEPYAKKADVVSNFQTNVTMHQDQPLVADISYGKLLSAALSFEEKQKHMQFKNGELRLGGGEAKLPSESGLIVSAKFEKLEWATLDPYYKWLNSQIAKLNPTSSKKTSETRNFFRGIDLQADAATFFGQHFDRARLQVRKNDNNWQANIDSNQVAGKVTVTKNLAQVQAQFERLYFASASGTNELSMNPKKFPALVISVNDLRAGSIRLGRVSVKTIPSQNGLQIQKLQINTGTADLQALGSWNGTTSYLQGTLSSNNVSQMLTSWGMNASALVGSSAQATFDLSWTGAPYNPSLAS
ncbi:MAG: YhdP family protein, partial [Gammaproteobacteria bacterium]